MAATFNKKGYDNAVRLIKAGEISTFDANWNEEKPTQDEVVRFINTHFMSEYGLWFLGTDSKFPADAKEHYIYPYGDLKTVQRCAIVDTMEKAKKNNDAQIANSAKELLAMVDKNK
ncbi:hypothetical protein HYX58_00590 [Candidatus Dependentiae bacterium]|nr:hypothetical protein [Candidatus Dependentiae bacterium]